ncbi:MAG: glycosyltransferase family 25 protein [Ferruginibacter sp.]
MHDFTILNNFFEHIYVITLERAQDRQQQIRKNLAGLQYEFFFGADKLSHEVDDLIKQGIYDKALAAKHHRYHKTLTSGQVCCAWSHRNVYEDVLERGFKKVLILEDDVTAIQNVGEFAYQVFNELPTQWELLYMDYNANEKRDRLKQYWYHVQKKMGGLKWSHSTIQNLYPKKISKHLSSAGYHDFTSAYAITSQAAQQLIKMQTPIAFIADNLLATACTTKLIKGFVSRPKLFSQLSQGSSKFTHSYVDE